LTKGIALAIGLNAVDPKKYDGWSGDLNACESDATDITEMAKAQKFEQATMLLTKNATRRKVKAKIVEAAKALKAGDIFVLYYSGHGGQLPDINNDEELDNEDETWCLYDGELVDDELHSYLKRFAQGVRVFVMSDSCHSGTVTKQAFYSDKLEIRNTNTDDRNVKYKFMPADVARRAYRANKEFYDSILRDSSLKESRSKVKASVLLISGCQDNQLSSDGVFNSKFTAELLAVWNNGRFRGDYRKFHKKIVRRMPPDQTPNFYMIGEKNPTYEAQKPFTV